MTESSIPGVQFDTGKIAQLTTLQVHDFFQANRRVNTQKQAETLALVVKTCPDEWGRVDDPLTYENRPLKREFIPLVRTFRELITEADTAEIPDLTFDIGNMLAKDMGDFFGAVNISDMKTVSAVLTRVVKTCPKDWGAVDAADTYLKRPYPQFLGIVNRFIREVNDDSKK